MRVRDNSRVWGAQYKQTAAEIFVVQDEISNEIIQNLRLKLTGKELERLKKRYTENSEAFKLYFKGRYFWNKRTKDDLERAIDYFNQALQIDSNYALAYTGLAHSYLIIPEYGNYPPKEAYQKSKEAALKALSIDDQLAEARTSLAQIKRRYDWDWQGAEREYKWAIELDPGDSTAHHW
jgi:tetratricopeptide (TPR) repeat protein